MNTEQLLDDVLDLDNILRAVKQVKSNKGCAGVDEMKVSELDNYVNSRKLHNLIEDIRNGNYKPSPVKMIEIPKSDGTKRMLGIPTVIDRVVQQAINQILTKIYDSQFSKYSYGFRPNIGAHDALAQAEKYVQEGAEYIVDIDISKFFDTINRDKLMVLLKKDIHDKRLLRLINKFLFSGMLKGNQFITTNAGTPQGSPLSPILSNIYLNELDKTLENRGIKFCRYADDVQIYSNSIRSAYRVLASTTNLLESKAFGLKTNKEKSKVKELENAKFLGYTFRYNYFGEVVLAVHPKSVKNFKDKVREILKRNRGISIVRYIKEINQLTVGWVNYFHLGITHIYLSNLQSWIRRKIRTILWKQWKTTKNRKRQQRKFSIRKRTFTNSSRGMFYVAKYKLNTILTNEVMKYEFGFIPLTDTLTKVRNKIKEPDTCVQLLLF